MKLSQRLEKLEAKAGIGQPEHMEDFLARHAAMLGDGRIVRDGETVYASDPSDVEAVEMAGLHTEALKGLAEWEAHCMDESSEQ